MGKFPFKRLRIISKKFPEIDSHVESVSKSLEGLVFSYSDQVEKALQKKHILMAVSSLAVLVVIGSLISPYGKADSTIFYPKTCLGGWQNPHNAEGEPQTTSNQDVAQFDASNSAVLPKNTGADVYCGNFVGKFDEATKPTKIIVTLAMTNGEVAAIATATPITNDIVASSTESPVDLSSTTNNLTPLLQSSSTSTNGSSSTQSVGSSSSSVDIATSTASTPVAKEATSLVGNAVNTIKDAFQSLFGGSAVQQTDTVVIPTPPPTDTTSPASPTPNSSSTPTDAQPSTPPATPPTSFLDRAFHTLARNFVTSVFAQESAMESTTQSVVIDQTTDTTTRTSASIDSSSSQAQTTVEPRTTEKKTAGTVTSSTSDKGSGDSARKVSTSSTSGTVLGDSTTTLDASTTQSDSATTTGATTTADASSTIITASTTRTLEDDSQKQNNFLEVFYTFDGKTWQSLGELNEISMKYRTFEIPVSASMSWSDMSQLQIKIESRKHDATPAVYLDGMKVEVLYETTLLHVHPDFQRDTIVKDEVMDGIRIVTIINNDTNRREVWYMYVEDTASSTEVASSTLITSTSTYEASSSTEIITSLLATTTDATTTVLTASSTTVIKPVMPKNTWLKFEGKSEGITSAVLLEEIKKLDELKLDPEKQDRLPDFTLDVIKNIKGTFLNAVVLQLEKNGQEELWLYNVENGTEEKIDMGTSTSLSVDSPLGVKGGHIFWLSGDESQVIAYNLQTKVMQTGQLPPFDASKGERGEVTFPGIPWKVIVSVNGFSFYSGETGEVFSDDDGSVAEALRQKLKLDTVLNADQISNLNLPVDGKEGEGRGSGSSELEKNSTTTAGIKNVQ